jgi:hypothetical protein
MNIGQFQNAVDGRIAGEMDAPLVGRVIRAERQGR